MIKEYTECGINKNTYNLLFQSDAIHNNDFVLNQINSKKWQIIKLIEYYTTINDKSITGMIHKLFYQKFIEEKIANISFNKENMQCQYSDDENLISFKKFAYIVNDDLKRELFSFRRYGKCHEMSLLLAPNIKGSNVVTGYIEIDSLKILHSVIKIFRNEESYILDYTKNIMMKEKQYVELYDFQPISLIPCTVIKSDIKKISGKVSFGLDTYTVFRNEIINDMEKNSLFNNNFLLQKTIRKSKK